MPNELRPRSNSSPAFWANSPSYSPTSTRSVPTSPTFSIPSPIYSPSSPIHARFSPSYSYSPPTHLPFSSNIRTSPTYSPPMSPIYAPASPHYNLTSQHYHMQTSLARIESGPLVNTVEPEVITLSSDNESEVEDEEDLEDEQNVFEMEHICAFRVVNNQLQFRIAWKNEVKKTWEPESSFIGPESIQILKQFKEENRSRIDANLAKPRKRKVDERTDNDQKMQVNTADITVAWGQQPHQHDSQYEKWRLAVFQDVQESIDASKLYFLYDPMADEQSGTSGQRKGYPGLIIFDVNLRCFAGEISVHSPGKMKFLFALRCPSPQGGSSFVLVTEEEMHGQIRLNISRVDLAQDGLSIANVRPLINQPLVIGGEYICSMRDDAPEIVVLANPGLHIWRVDCMAEAAQPPIADFNVPGAKLDHFYDGFLNNGNVIFLSATPDGHFDNTRVHILNLNNPQHITSQNTSGDPSRGMPMPRKQCGFDSITNAILMAGGKIDRGDGNVERLVDYWVLDTRTFQWMQIPSQMPCPLIEPRLTSANSGNIYVWGDFDQPLPGMPPNGTHLRILRVSGLEKANHPPGYTPYQAPAPPAYPHLDDSKSNPPYPPAGGNQGGYPGQNQGGYPGQNQGGYPGSNQGGYSGGNQGGYQAHPQQAPQQQAPPYPSYNPNQNAGQPQYQQQNPLSQYAGDHSGTYQNTPDGQTAFYPNKKQKKDCSNQ